MGQIITSLINFFLEISGSGERYKTQRNRSKALTICMWFFLALTVYISIESFNSAFASKAEVIKLRKQNEALQELKHENDTLRIRNEILSSTLSRYLGQRLVNQINDEDESGLKDTIIEPEVKPVKKLKP